MIKEFWLVNLSKRNVCLRDLALTIPAQRSMNLLDSKHFNYTQDQLETSATSGSIFAKSKMVKVRKIAPVVAVKPGIYVLNEPRNIPLRSQVVIVNKKLEDLLEIDDDANISDQKFAMDFVSDDEIKKK